MDEQPREEKILALRDRILELTLAIQDIERNRRELPQREHPSQEYVDGLKFDLRGYRAELGQLEKNHDENAGEDPRPLPANVVSILHPRNN